MVEHHYNPAGGPIVAGGMIETVRVTSPLLDMRALMDPRQCYDLITTSLLMAQHELEAGL